jgi:hypothetical protein
MKRYTFDVAEHEEYGELGFKPSWYPNGDPLGGGAVAHDILEHFAHDQGDAEGEFQALGAALFIRGESGYFQRNGNVNSPEVHIGSGLAEIWSLHTDRDYRSTFRPCGVIQYPETMAQCREAVKSGLKEFAERELTEPSPRDCELIARWMGKGYKRAERRYKQHDSYSIAYSLFAPIEEAANNALKYAEAGMVLTVLVDFARLKVDVSCDYPGEE